MCIRDRYTDTVSISKTGQERFRYLSSVSSMDYQNRFEREVTDIFVKEDTAVSYTHLVTMKNGTALIAKKNYPEFVKQDLKYNQRKGNEVR